jgi:hypothetical protein
LIRPRTFIQDIIIHCSLTRNCEGLSGLVKYPCEVFATFSTGEYFLNKKEVLPTFSCLVFIDSTLGYIQRGIVECIK